MEDKQKKVTEQPKGYSTKKGRYTSTHHTHSKETPHHAKKAKWEVIKKCHTEKKILKGIVTNIVKEGIIVKILGWFAYLHKNYVSTSLYEKIEKGDIIEVIITKLQETDEGNRIWVSNKHAIGIKRENTKSYPIGATIVGSVITVKNNGIIVFVKAGTLGWINTSESTLAEMSNLGITLKKKEQLHLVVDDNTKSLLLKLDYEYYNKLEKAKQLSQQEKDYILFKENLQPGISTHRAQVTGINKGYVEINVEGYQGYIEKEDLSWEWVKNPADEVFLGETIEVLFDEEKNGKLYFSLKWQDVKLYVDEYYTANTDTLLNVLGITKNEFVGKIIPFNNKTLAVSVMAISEDDYGKLLVDPFTGKNLTVEVPERYELTPQNYYAFSLIVSSEEERRNRQQPFSFDIYLESAAIPLENPYKKEVERNFRLNDNPKSNRETARLLKEIGADMYADRDRMFYELLQNADDAAPVKGVQIKIQVKGEYLIFTHNGLPFSLADFKSINSAANSTKPNDSKKTGYKGIGFKSVFTDAQEVYIRTGGFNFKYDRCSKLFDSFDEFYSSVYDGDMAIFNEKFKEYKNNYHKAEDLPWQMLPFWIDELPNELQNTLIGQYHNVSIALKVGIRAKSYEDKIYKIIKSSKFMLFLRNTNRIQLEYEGKLISLAIEKQDGNVVELKNSFDKNSQTNLYYLNKTGCEIGTTNENFQKCNVPIKKTCQQVGDRQKWSLYEMTNNGDILITSVPERIIESDSTTISYAFRFEEGKGVVCNPPSVLSLYAYLPMEDRRYVLPFFVNADFELSSNRQEAKRNAKWNQFIFYNIGRKLCEWVGKVATIGNSEYLSLIPTKWFEEKLDDEKEDYLASDFNRGLREGLVTEPFILNDKGEIVRQSDILLDESKLAVIIGNDVYCQLLETKKRLPHSSLNYSYLDNNLIFEGVEHIQTTQILDVIFDKGNLKRVLRYWHSISDKTRFDILTWLVSKINNDEKWKAIIERIPAFNLQTKLYSFKEIMKREELCILNNTTISVTLILKKLGLKCSENIFSNHPLASILYEDKTSYDNTLFTKITKVCEKNANRLSAEEKHALFSCYKQPTSGISDKKISKWKLFSNRKGEPCSLCCLTNIDSTLYGNVIDSYSISEEEYKEELNNYLIVPQDIFSNIAYGEWDSLVESAGKNETKVLSLYKFVIDRYNEAVQRKVEGLEQFDFANKKIIFADEAMHSSGECFINHEVSKDEEASKIVRLLSNRCIPCHDIAEYITKPPFKCQKDTLGNLVVNTTQKLSENEVRSILNLCKATKDSLFTKNEISKTEEGYFIAALPIHGNMAYTEDTNLRNAISSFYPNIKNLPEELKEYKDLNGVLTDDELLLKIIDVDKEIDKHATFLLNYIESSVSITKKNFLNKLYSINISPVNLGEKECVEFRLLSLIGSIEKPTQEFYDGLRNKINILVNEKQIPLLSINAQRNIRVGKVDFPLSKLMPDEDAQAIAVSTVIEKLKVAGISQDVINKIFKAETDSGYVQETFESLNKKDVTLKSGCQLAFVLNYAAESSVKNVVCKILTAEKTISRDLQSTWFYKAPSFIKDTFVLNEQYADIEAYLHLPFQKANVFIEKDIVDYNGKIKENLVDEMKHELLSYVYTKWKENHKPLKSENTQAIRQALGITTGMMFAEEKYLLPHEVLPTCIIQWLMSKNAEKRKEFAELVLQIPNSSCNVISVRQYLDSVGKWKDYDNITDFMRKQVCEWISAKKLHLDTFQYMNLCEFLSEKNYMTNVNENLLMSHANMNNFIFGFKDYSIYDCKDSIPYEAKLREDSYVFHTYKEGDVWIIEKNIFINSSCIPIEDGIKTLTSIGKLSTDDYFAFVNAPKEPEYVARLEGGMDNDIEEKRRIAKSTLAKEEAKIWLIAHGYTIPNGMGEYSCFEVMDDAGKYYPVVVKSICDDLFVNPNEWLQLVKPNSRLILYLGHGKITVINRKQLLKSNDFLFLRIARENFEGNDLLDERLTKINECLQFFQRTHIIFEKLGRENFKTSSSLDDLGLYEFNEKINTTEDSLSDL